MTVDVATIVVPRLPWTAGEYVDMGFEIIAVRGKQACEVVFWILLRPMGRGRCC